jgi:hypothetical protein
MKHRFFDQVMQDFEEERYGVLEQALNPLERFRAMSPVVAKYLKKFRDYVVKHPFNDESHEIDFYKRIKPTLYSQLILESLRFNLYHNKPAGTEDDVFNYWREELKLISRFFQVNAFHYQYYKLKFTELDKTYFLQANRLDSPLPDSALIEADFSTNMDYQFAKFIAYEQLQELILLELKANPAISENGIKLKWTGDAINLVELAYGLWLTGQINNGNATIADIVRFLECGFEIKIGRPFRRWTEITQRKQLSPTRFIDQMKGGIIKRIDNELSLKTTKRKQPNS